MGELNNYNPLSAPEKTSGSFTNIARCTRNEVIDMPLAVRQAATPVIPANIYIPYWVMEYECLDTVWSDGNPKKLYFSTRLFDKEGNPLDKTQRPAVCATAFAGLVDEAGNPTPIIVFPEDPNYSADAVVGRVFQTRQHKFGVGKDAPVPALAMAPDYTFTGTVKTLQSTNASVSGDAITNAAVAKEASAAQLAEIAAAIGPDTADTKAVTQKLLATGMGNGLTIDGVGINSLAVQGKLIGALTAHGVLS
jgi:hypothetical protein